MFRCQSHLMYGLFFIISIMQFCNVLAEVVSNCSGYEASNKKQWISWSDNQDKYSIDNKQLLMTTAQANHLPNDTVWVDVRTKSAQLHTPLNILTIPLNQLESKNFLFDQTVELVGTGFDQFVINKTINQLKAKGFKHLFALSVGIAGMN